MDSIQQFLANPDNVIPVLFALIALGVLLGRIEWKGVSLGTSGVLFVAILFGHFGARMPGFVTEIGVALFVYAVGLQAGPRFFKTFRSQGLSFAALAFVTLLSGLLVTLAVEAFFDFGAGLSTGLYTGSMTTTPGLAAALEAVDEPSWPEQVSVGYGIAYPFGVAGVVLFVQLFPRLMRMDLKKIAREERHRGDSARPVGRWFELRNPQLAGQTIEDFSQQHIATASITRVERRGGRTEVAHDALRLELGDKLRIVSTPEDQRVLETVIGPVVEQKQEPRQTQSDIVSRDVFVTEDAMAGIRLDEMHVREDHGVIIARLWREELEFIPQGNTRLMVGDLVRIVGRSEDCDRFQKLLGNAEKRLQETNFLPLAAGLALGILAGRVPIPVPGTEVSFKLGLAGGPLFLALLAGHFGRVGRINIRMPVAAKIFIRELGLMFFLAGAGTRAGASFASVLQEQGISLFLAGALITIAPMAASWFFARLVMRLEILPTLGAICGGMTSTPALGALSTASDSETPALAYATVYPVALIVVTVLAQLLGRVMSGLM